MAGRGRRFPHNDYVSKQIADAREVVQQSEALLQQAKPDTFAGRKSREPEDPMARTDIQKLINSELQPPD